MRSMVKKSRLTTRAAAALFALVLLAMPSSAQYRTASAVVAGEPVSKESVSSAGSAGRALSSLVGVRPTLVIFWRPGDAQSEQAVAVASDARERGLIDVAILAPAVLAAGQRPTAIGGRLSTIGLTALEAPADTGSLARMFGIRRVPTVGLIDAGGVLRFLGASSVLQDAGEGMKLLDAIGMAGRGEAVPTLGVLPSRPVYRLLGQQLPQLAVTEPDGTTWRKVNDFFEPDKNLMLFYWAPDCPHCREELPKLCKWYRESKPDDVVLVDLARTGGVPAERSVWRDLIADCPTTHLLDPNRLAGRTLLVTETPTAFMVDSSGEILSIQVGGDVDWGRWAGGGPNAPGSDAVAAGSSP